MASVTQMGTHIPRQTFIDKELDGENGLGDFGVRKYEAETGRFSSVDALWESFRTTTAFNYAENNPTALVDASGLTVTLSAQDQDLLDRGMQELQSSTGLTLWRNDDGTLEAMGPPATMSDAALFDAISREDVDARIHLTYANLTSDLGDKPIPIVGGAPIAVVNNAGIAHAFYSVNLDHFVSIGGAGGGHTGDQLTHEVLEASRVGSLMSSMGDGYHQIPTALRDRAHAEAMALQPLLPRVDQRIEFNSLRREMKVSVYVPLTGKTVELYTIPCPRCP